MMNSYRHRRTAAITTATNTTTGELLLFALFDNYVIYCTRGRFSPCYATEIK